MTKKKAIEQELKAIEKQSYDLKPLRELPIFSDEQIQKIIEIKEDLATSFKRLELGRPKYLMEVSILKDTKFPTPDAKYWQCLLERNVQFQNMLFEALDFQEKIADLEEKEAGIEDLEAKNPDHNRLTKVKVMKLEVQKKRLLLQMLQLKKTASERYRELMAWTDLIQELKPSLKHGEENPEEHMPESFLIRFAEQKRMLEEVGASDMNGAMNILGLGKTAARYWREKKVEAEKNDRL